MLEGILGGLPAGPSGPPASPGTGRHSGRASRREEALGRGPAAKMRKHELHQYAGSTYTSTCHVGLSYDQASVSRANACSRPNVAGGSMAAEAEVLKRPS